MMEGKPTGIKPRTLLGSTRTPGGVITEGALATRPKGYDFSGRVPVSSIGPPAVALALKDATTMTSQVVRREDYEQIWW